MELNFHPLIGVMSGVIIGIYKIILLEASILTIDNIIESSIMTAILTVVGLIITGMAKYISKNWRVLLAKFQKKK